MKDLTQTWLIGILAKFVLDPSLRYRFTQDDDELMVITIFFVVFNKLPSFILKGFCFLVKFCAKKYILKFMFLACCVSRQQFRQHLEIVKEVRNDGYW